MDTQSTYDTIRQTIHALLPDSRILLFGSRARGTQDKQSDYDLLVIIPGIFTKKEMLNWSSQLDRAIVHAIHAPIDLLIYSEAEVLEKRELPGHIVRSAMREGIAL